MSITTVEAQFVAALANVINTAAAINNLGPWPIRWPNELFIPGIGGVVALTPDNAPADANGNPAPFVEAEVISGPDSACIAPPGSRQSYTLGLFRVYLVTPLGSGRAAANILADAVHVAFKRMTVYYNPPERLTTMDPRIDDNNPEHVAQTNVRIDAAVPAPWKGARYVRQVSTPWFWDYAS
jgi:hypothetical protein